MQVTVNRVVYSGGTMGYANGTDENGNDVWFAMDWRPARDVAEAIEAEGELLCEVEDWQFCGKPDGADPVDTDAVNIDLQPFMGVKFNKNRTVNGVEYKIIIYSAYNAMGLIGYECNGIAILNNTEKSVVADEICKQTSGYFGPSEKQLQAAKAIAEEYSDDEFIAFVNKQQRLRYAIA